MDRNRVVPKVAPILDTRRAASRLVGVRTQKQQDIEAEKSNRFRPDIIHPVITMTTPYWFRENLGSSGDASYATRMPIPDAATTFNSVSSGNIIMPCGGWVIGAFMELSTARTAGSVTGRIIIDGDTFSFDDALQIDANSVNTSAVSFFTPFSTEFPFAEDSLIRGSFLTAGTFAPTTADGRLWFVLRLDVT